MKTLLLKMRLLGCFALLIIGERVNGQQTPGQADTNTVVAEKSLNGIPYTAASKMVQAAYAANVDPMPANTQIWFSKKSIVAVYNLLMHEDSVGLIKPDGIRIYFSSSDTAANSTPTHLNNSVVVVSTYWSGRVKNSMGGGYTKVHTDYFEHDASAGLFGINPDSLAGIVTHYNDATMGTMLYSICNCDNQDTCVTTSDHFIKRGVGETMVQAFQGQPFKARSEWFDINMLINLFYEMNCSNEDGIRIYFARATSSTDAAYAGKARFVIVTTTPTTTTVNGQQVIIHQDRLSCNCTNSGLAAKARAAIRYGVEQRRIAKGQPGKGGNDNGEQCPNNCDGVTLP
jgi:hypothetical protein